MGVGVIGPVASGGGGKIEKTEKITSTQTWTAPDDVYEVEVIICGGGGGGAKSQDNNIAGPSGGGSAYYEVLSVTPGSSYSISIGAGGSQANVDGGNASTGGTSTFSNLFSATGGGGGRGGNLETGTGSGLGSGGMIFTYTSSYLHPSAHSNGGYLGSYGGGGGIKFSNNSERFGYGGSQPGKGGDGGRTNGSNAEQGNPGICIIKYWTAG